MTVPQVTNEYERTEPLTDETIRLVSDALDLLGVRKENPLKEYRDRSVNNEHGAAYRSIFQMLFEVRCYGKQGIPKDTVGGISRLLVYQGIARKLQIYTDAWAPPPGSEGTKQLFADLSKALFAFAQKHGGGSNQ